MTIKCHCHFPQPFWFKPIASYRMAQHDSQEFPGGAAQLTFSELPDNAVELTVGFYNVAIQVVDLEGERWKTEELCLQADILKAFNRHLDVFCLSEVGEPSVGIGASVPHGDVAAWILELLKDSAVPPVDIFSESHYATIVKKNRVKVDQYNFVDGFVPHQADRSFQHLRVRVEGDEASISIVNCHATASKKRVLTTDVRKRYFTAAHNACAGDRFIWGGDFQTAPVLFGALMHSIDFRYTNAQGGSSSAAQPGSLQFVFSYTNRIRHGAMAATYGLHGVQLDSEGGRFFEGGSDAHDLVIAKVFATGGSRRPLAASYAPRREAEINVEPATDYEEDESSSSAEQLVPCNKRFKTSSESWAMHGMETPPTGVVECTASGRASKKRAVETRPPSTITSSASSTAELQPIPSSSSEMKLHPI